MTMDKEKRIIEIAKDMCFHADSCVTGKEDKCHERNCETTWLAEKLVNLNYQKISLDDIVISREDYDDLLQLTRTNTIDRVLNWLWTSKDIKQEILNLAKQHNIELEEKRWML